jgi:hypothetical protein
MYRQSFFCLTCTIIDFGDLSVCHIFNLNHFEHGHCHIIDAYFSRRWYGSRHRTGFVDDASGNQR